MGWHWFIKQYRFQLYRSTKHHLYTASLPMPQRKVSLSPFTPPLATSTYSLPGFPLVIPQCFLCLCIIYVWFFKKFILFCFVFAQSFYLLRTITFKTQNNNTPILTETSVNGPKLEKNIMTNEPWPMKPKSIF